MNYSIPKKIVLVTIFAALFVVSSHHAAAQKDDIAGSTSVFATKPATTTTTPRKTIRRLKAPKRPSTVSSKPVAETTATATKKPKTAADKPTTKTASPESGASPAGKWNGFVVGDEHAFLNLNAKSRPLPKWTREAQAAHADGLVQVGVVVDENGSVISAKGRTGNKLLWESAEQAALQATFDPPKVYGKPARMIGFMVYCFGNHPDCN